MTVTVSETISESLATALRRSAEIEREITDKDRPTAFRILTGERPTGHLHLGHYFGTLRNRVRLQDAGAEIFLVIADYQVLTDRDSADHLDEYVTGCVLDYLAIGIDPAKSVIFAHSAVPALNQLLLPFLSLVTVPELRRNPTVKDETAQSRQSSVSGLMFTYPVHQAADILFCKSNLVPVGQDQLPHVEVTRLVARRFNERYGPTFPEPDALLSAAPLLLGTDGGKMSKSRGNAIELRASSDETARLIRTAKTDSRRHISYDPEGRPEVSSLVLLAALCAERDPESVAAEIGDGGAAALKRVVTEAVNERFAPVRARRAELARDMGYVRQVLRDGCERARAIANTTLAEVRAAMGMDYGREENLLFSCGQATFYGARAGGAMNENAKDVPWWGAVSAAAAPLLLIAGITAASQLQPPQFDVLNNTVSALAGQGAVDSWVMTFTFLVVAACEILTALALRPAGRPGRIVLVAAGFAGAMVAVFPEHLGGSLIHAFWAGAGFGGLILWPALAWRRGPGVPWALRPAACAAACVALSALMIWFAVEEVTRGGEMGLSERALGVTQTFWPMLVAFSCRRHRPGEVPAMDAAPM